MCWVQGGQIHTQNKYLSLWGQVAALVKIRRGQYNATHLLPVGMVSFPGLSTDLRSADFSCGGSQVSPGEGKAMWLSPCITSICDYVATLYMDVLGKCKGGGRRGSTWQLALFIWVVENPLHGRCPLVAFQVDPTVNQVCGIFFTINQFQRTPKIPMST